MHLSLFQGVQDMCCVAGQVALGSLCTVQLSRCSLCCCTGMSDMLTGYGIMLFCCVQCWVLGHSCVSQAGGPCSRTCYSGDGAAPSSLTLLFEKLLKTYGSRGQLLQLFKGGPAVAVVQSSAASRTFAIGASGVSMITTCPMRLHHCTL